SPCLPQSCVSPLPPSLALPLPAAVTRFSPPPLARSPPACSCHTFLPSSPRSLSPCLQLSHVSPLLPSLALPLPAAVTRFSPPPLARSPPACSCHTFLPSSPRSLSPCLQLSHVSPLLPSLALPLPAAVTRFSPPPLARSPPACSCHTFLPSSPRSLSPCLQLSHVSPLLPSLALPLPAAVTRFSPPPLARSPPACSCHTFLPSSPRSLSPCLQLSHVSPLLPSLALPLPAAVTRFSPPPLARSPPACSCHTFLPSSPRSLSPCLQLSHVSPLLPSLALPLPAAVTRFSPPPLARSPPACSCHTFLPSSPRSLSPCLQLSHVSPLLPSLALPLPAAVTRFSPPPLARSPPACSCHTFLPSSPRSLSPCLQLSHVSPLLPSLALPLPAAVTRFSPPPLARSPPACSCHTFPPSSPPSLSPFLQLSHVSPLLPSLALPLPAAVTRFSPPPLARSPPAC